jgi:endoribonuclease L-PSP
MMVKDLTSNCLAQSASVCGVAENHAIAAIKQVAEEAGFEMTDIVSVTVYVTDLNDVPKMNEVYRKLIYELKKLRAIRVPGPGEYAKARTKKAHLARDGRRCSGSQAGA